MKVLIWNVEGESSKMGNASMPVFHFMYPIVCYAIIQEVVTRQLSGDKLCLTWSSRHKEQGELRARGKTGQLFRPVRGERGEEEKKSRHRRAPNRLRIGLRPASGLTGYV